MHSPPAHCQVVLPKTMSVCLSAQPWCKLELTLLDTLGWIQTSRGSNGPVALHLPAMPSAVLLFQSGAWGRVALQAFPDFPLRVVSLSQSGLFCLLLEFHHLV